MEVVLWLLSALGLAGLAFGRIGSRTLFLLLALHWLWSGIVYHWGYFASVNPAARLFGALFVLQGVLFLWLGFVGRGPAFSWGRAPRQALSVAFGLDALAYPLLALGSGLSWPRMPAFGVPCPTTLFTVSLLLALEPRRLWGLAVIPFLWAVVGGSTALLLGVVPDLALFLAAAALLLYALAPRMLSRTPEAPTSSAAGAP